MLEQRVLDFFADTCPVQPGDTLLVAVSGGADSVALLHLLLAVRDTLGARLEVAHLNHGIRGGEAVDDARFVADLAARNGLSLHQRSVDVPALLDQEGGSLEAVARRERYAFLEGARGVAGARWIVTGHTADDQVETFLMNLFRGAGPRGLGGMLPVGPGSMCRPLLQSWRVEILEYIDRVGATCRVDSSNADVSLTRNRIRLQVVPNLIAELGPEVPAILARESQLMNEVEEFLNLESDAALKEITAHTPPASSTEVRLPVRELFRHPRVLQRSMLRAAIEDLAGGLEDLTLGHVDAVLNLLNGGEGSAEVHLPRGVVARREYNMLAIALEQGGAPRPPLEASPPLGLDGPGEIRWGPIHLRWDFARGPVIDPTRWADHPGRICLDRERIVEPLYVRAVRPGDRIEPFGMEGTQKLSDLLIDRKIPRRRRTRVAVLCDNGGSQAGERILWVVGQRRARFAPIHPETSQVLLLEAETIV